MASTTIGYSKTKDGNTVGGNVSFNFDPDEFSERLLEKLEKISKDQAKAMVMFKFKRRLQNGGYGIKAKQYTVTNRYGKEYKYTRTNNSIKNWNFSVKKTESNIQVGFTNNTVDPTGDFKYVHTLYGKKTEDGRKHKFYGHKEGTPDGFASRDQGLDEARVKKIKEEIRKQFAKEIEKGIVGDKLWQY